MCSRGSCFRLYPNAHIQKHLGGLLDLARTRFSAFPFTVAVCVCANTAVVLQQAQPWGPQPCQTGAHICSQD